MHRTPAASQRRSPAIGVGIVGASASRGWAGRAHVPALHSLEDFRINAVCTRSRTSADASAERFGIPVAVTDPAALIERRDVELVVICVKAPDHRDLALQALAAGKHVFCEWPLARDAAEAAKMADAARRHGTRCMVGLQARAAPALNRMRALVQEGYVGRALAWDLRHEVATLGTGRLTSASAYTADARNGANVLTIPGGHALDALCFCAGEFTELSAKLATQVTSAVIEETGESIAVTAPDHMVLHGVLPEGALASCQVRGAALGGPRFELRVAGTDGSLTLRSVETPGASGMQMSRLVLSGAREGSAEAPLGPDDPAAGPQANVRRLYVRLAHAIGDGGAAGPDFDDGLRRHRLLDAIATASHSGRVQRPSSRP